MIMNVEQLEELELAGEIEERGENSPNKSKGKKVKLSL
jgi:hypothetical protein